MPISGKDLPGPKGLPIIGNLYQIPLSKRHAIFEKWAEQYGPVYALQLGPVRLTVISAPQMIHQMLKARPDAFRRISRLDRIMQAEGVQGVFNAEGEEWKVHRRIVTRGLDLKHQERFFPSMVTIVNRLLRKLEFSAEANTPLQIQADLLRFTVDVTTSLAFGMDMNTLEQKGGVIQDHMEKIFPMLFRRINSPFPLYKIFPSKQDRDYRTSMDEIERFIHQLIESGKTRIQTKPSLQDKPENILESLLVAATSERAISEKEIRGNLMTLLMAGEDTTAYSLAWAIYLICRHPEVQQRLQEEADLVLGTRQVMDTYESHSALVYTHAVVQESLRLKAVAPVLLIEPNQDIELEGYYLEKGSKLALLIRSAALRQEYFSEAGSFVPDRWLPEGKSACPVHRTEAFMPFGSGPRLCPGMHLATLEMKLVLSMLARNLTMELVHPEENVEEQMAFTMKPGSFEIRLKKRNGFQGP